MDNVQNKILEELVEIRKLLTILSQDKLDAFSQSVKDKYLGTPKRQMMYDLFDGTRSLKDIGDEVGVSSEAVRQFAVSLEKAGLLTYVTDNSRSKLPKRLF